MTSINPITIHGSTYHQTTNSTSPQGGGIEYHKKLLTDTIENESQLTFISSSEIDTTQTYLIEGKTTKRITETESLTLNGTTPVSTLKTYTRINNITKQTGNPINGYITITAAGNTIGIMDPGSLSEPDTAITITTDEIETTHLLNLLNNAQGKLTSTISYYEKIFIRNNTGNQINQLTITEQQSDFEGNISFTTDTTYNQTTTSTNRITRPQSIPLNNMLNSDPITITNIPNGAAIGLWLRITLPEGAQQPLHQWKIKITYDGETQINNIINPETPSESLTEILLKRNEHQIGGGNPLQFIELKNAKIVEQLHYQPDPKTYRDQYYYNTRLNKLFKKIQTTQHPVWKTAH